MQKNNWIDETLKELECRKAYGKVILHFENGNIQRITVEQSIKKPIDKHKNNT